MNRVSFCHEYAVLFVVFNFIVMMLLKNSLWKSFNLNFLKKVMIFIALLPNILYMKFKLFGLKNRLMRSRIKCFPHLLKFVLIFNKTALSTRGHEHWVDIYQTVFGSLPSLYFVAVLCARVRLITWNPALLAWRIFIWKYIKVIIHCTSLFISFQKPSAFLFLWPPSTKGSHFFPYWACVCGTVSWASRMQGWISNMASTFPHHLKLIPFPDVSFLKSSSTSLCSSHHDYVV